MSTTASVYSADVVIVGGGVAGCSAAYHITSAGSSVVLLETGSPGDGSMDPVQIPNDTFTRDGDRTEDGNVFRFGHRSGTAVLPTASCVKMIANLFCSSSTEFIRHHGVEGAERYLRLAYSGLNIEKKLAKKALVNPDDLHELGLLYVAYKEDRDEFLKEFECLQSLGCRDIELWERDKVQDATGGACANFDLGIYFPHDAIINSAQVSMVHFN